MSISDLDDLLKTLEANQKIKAEPVIVKTPEPRVSWRKRNSEGYIVAQRPRSARNLSKRGQYCLFIQLVDIGSTLQPIGLGDTVSTNQYHCYFKRLPRL